MTAGGVIPQHGPQEVGRMEDADGIAIAVCVERRAVRLEVGSSIALIDRDGAEEFAQLFVRACWLASMPP